MSDNSHGAHEFVYSDKPVWGGGYNVVCRKCGQVEGFSRDRDPDFLAGFNPPSSPPTLIVSGFIVTEAQKNDPWAPRHWSKDRHVPYANCWCATCRDAMARMEPSLPPTGIKS